MLAVCVMLLGLASLEADAMGGFWVTAKVLDYSKPNYRVTTQHHEIVVNEKFMNPAHVKKMRAAKKNQMVNFLVPNNALVSMKKIDSTPNKGSKK